MPVEVAPRPTNEERIRAALWFAGRGFGIFSVWSTTAKGTCHCPKGAACAQAGKHPITEHGFQDATTDPERIRTFLSAGSDPNYGIVPPEGVFALDVDGEGIPNLAKLEARLGGLPPTLRTKTAHGEHIFLQWPAALPRPIGQLWGFVTRWGSGNNAGYVIGPRSVHASGAVYEPLGSVYEITELPEKWAHDALTPPKSETSITIKGPSTIAVGNRHVYLRNQARYLVGIGLTGAALEAAVMDLNRQLPEPKATEDVRRAIGEAEAKFQRDPIDPETGGRIHSAQAPVGMGTKIEGLPFLTGADVSSLSTEAIDWAWAEYLAYGTIMEIVGPPKAGKTTLVFSLIRAYLDGLRFLDRTTSGGPVVVLTEQGPTSLRAVLQRTDLDGREDVHFLLHRDARNQTWPDVVASSVAHCQKVGARVLVIDTLSAFAGIQGDAENNAGDALAAMAPLMAAAEGGLAVLMNRHRRKGGAIDIADEGRGSGAFSGAVDVIVVLRRKDPASPHTMRVLASASRFDETPDELVIELEDGRYVSRGDDAAVEAAATRRAVLEALEAEPGTLPDLVEKTGKARQTIQRILVDLVGIKAVERQGRGTRGHAFRYALVEPFLDSLSAAPPTGEAVGRNESSPISDHWASPCRRYFDHQSAHYNRPDGWRCRRCEEEPA